MAKDWNVTRLGGIGFLLGVIFVQTELFFYPQAALSHYPIVAAILGGLNVRRGFWICRHQP